MPPDNLGRADSNDESNSSDQRLTAAGGDTATRPYAVRLLVDGGSDELLPGEMGIGTTKRPDLARGALPRLITLATVIGGAAPLLSAARKHLPTPAPSLVVRDGAVALALSSAAVAICSLLHFSDLRWLTPDQRGSLYLSAPSGFLGFTKPFVVVLNSVAGLPVEWRAAQASDRTAIVCALLAVAAFALAVLTRRRACRAEIRQIVQDEVRKATTVNRLCGTRPGRLRAEAASAPNFSPGGLRPPPGRDR